MAGSFMLEIYALLCAPFTDRDCDLVCARVRARNVGRQMRRAEIAATVCEAEFGNGSRLNLSN